MKKTAPGGQKKTGGDKKANQGGGPGGGASGAGRRTAGAGQANAGGNDSDTEDEGKRSRIFAGHILTFQEWSIPTYDAAGRLLAKHDPPGAELDGQNLTITGDKMKDLLPCWVQLQLRLPEGEILPPVKGEPKKLSDGRAACSVIGLQLITIPRMDFPHPWPNDVGFDEARGNDLATTNCITLRNLQELVMKSIYQDQFNGRRIYRQQVSARPRLPSLHFRFLTEEYGHSLGDVALRNDNDVAQVFAATEEKGMRFLLLATWTKQNDAGGDGKLEKWDSEHMVKEAPEDVDYSTYILRPQAC